MPELKTMTKLELLKRACESINRDLRCFKGLKANGIPAGGPAELNQNFVDLSIDRLTEQRDELYDEIDKLLPPGQVVARV